MKQPNKSEIMRHILKVLSGDKHKAAAVYAVLEERGVVARNSNVENWPYLRYALSLANNELRKHPHLI